MSLMPCCPSDRWGLPGALIPAYFFMPQGGIGGSDGWQGRCCGRGRAWWCPHQARCWSERTERSEALVAVGTVRLDWSASAVWACPGAVSPSRADMNPSQARGPCRPSPYRCVSARSYAFPAMAFPSPSRPCCPIRIVSVNLVDAAGKLLRVLCLDREGHISAQPHYVPRAEAMILASNQQIVLGPQAKVRVLLGSVPPRANPSRAFPQGPPASKSERHLKM
jgi:hypothetical protein